MYYSMAQGSYPPQCAPSVSSIRMPSSGLWFLVMVLESLLKTITPLMAQQNG